MQLGVDIEDVARFRRFTAKSAFTRKCYSAEEIKYCFSKPSPHEHLAARFAAKESFFKATQVRAGFSQVEVIRAADGRPSIAVKGRIRKDAKVSISHTAQCAVAVVLVEE
jgi:holo-[acyl-carrier protein] synthase